MSIESDHYFLDLFTRQAEAEGISLEELLRQVNAGLEVMNAPLPEEGRLSYVEAKIAQGVINVGQGDFLLRLNPILEVEMDSLMKEITETIGREYGLEIPDNYTVIHDQSYNRQGLIRESVDPLNRTITIPSEGGKFTAVVLSHALGHVYQNENSAIVANLRSLYASGDLNRYIEETVKAKVLTEGWAVFFSLLYARQRDIEHGVVLHANLEQELREWIGFNQYLRTQSPDNEYQRGFELYQRIYERFGFQGAHWAALYITTVEDLERFANDTESIFQI